MRASVPWVSLITSLALVGACNEAPGEPSISLTPETAYTLDKLEVAVVEEAVDANKKDTVSYRISWSRNGERLPVLDDSLQVLANQTRKGDVWTVEVSATDGSEFGGSASASVTIQNSLPTATLTLTPAAPKAGARLRTSVTTLDSDVDPVTVRYQWSVNGSVTSETGTDLAAGRVLKGEVWEVAVIANDGEADAEPVVASVTIANTAPSVQRAEVWPARPMRSSVMECRGTGWSDLDDDPPGYQVEWLVDGVSVSTDATYPAADLSRGQVVRCRLTPFDGDDTGPAVVSGDVLMGNTPPTIASVDIGPDDPLKGTVVSATLGATADQDGDPVTVQYDWTVNGVSVATTATLASSRYQKDDVIKLNVTPFDGIDKGTPVSSRTLIAANNQPKIDLLTLAPTTLYSDDILTATVITSDPDVDPVTVSYVWYVNGSVVPETGPELDGELYFDRGDSVYVVATPNDGDENGNSVTSSTVTVINKLPTAPEMDLDPADAEPGDGVVCDMITPSYDADGDTVTYAFRWTRDGVPYSGTTTTVYTGDTIPAEVTAEDELWRCSVIPSDGIGVGPAGETILDFREGPFEFTNCAATGQNGPSQSQCDTAYASTPLDGKVTVTKGIQTWTVPRSATYEIEVVGASGTSAASGRKGGAGARMTGEFSLKAGDELTLIVGQIGVSDGCSSGGGGGTWVLDETGKALIIAGGGGGTRTGASVDGCDAKTGEYAGSGSGGSSTSSCGTKTSALGNGGIVTSGSWGSAGAGLNANGGWEYSADNGGKTPANGATGGGNSSYRAYGGFGGGGSGNGSCGGGGGGGYSGGDGGWIGGGGGSYNTGSNTSSATGVGTSHGSVTINKIK